MEENNKNYNQLSFHGEGGKLFGIQIVNIILSILTLGIYYPWAKASVLKYLYQETEFLGSKFTFHGTGREMLRGFLFAVAYFILLYAGLMVCIYLAAENPELLFLQAIGIGIFYLGILAIIPIAIHGSLKYRLSRTSWRGIHFGYRGQLGVLYKKFLLDAFLTIITLGIYAAWMRANLSRYTIGNIRFGSVEFRFTGSGGELFGIFIVGYLLSIVTLGIYSFWWMKDIYNYYINNTHAIQDNEQIEIKSSITGGSLAGLLIVNIVLIIISLGLATPWATVRTLTYIYKNINISDALNPDTIQQTEEEYKDAIGEDIGDMLDLDLM